MARKSITYRGSRRDGWRYSVRVRRYIPETNTTLRVLPDWKDFCLPKPERKTKKG